MFNFSRKTAKAILLTFGTAGFVGLGAGVVQADVADQATGAVNRLATETATEVPGRVVPQTVPQAAGVNPGSVVEGAKGEVSQTVHQAESAVGTDVVDTVQSSTAPGYGTAGPALSAVAPVRGAADGVTDATGEVAGEGVTSPVEGAVEDTVQQVGEAEREHAVKDPSGDLEAIGESAVPGEIAAELPAAK